MLTKEIELRLVPNPIAIAKEKSDWFATKNLALLLVNFDCDLQLINNTTTVASKQVKKKNKNKKLKKPSTEVATNMPPSQLPGISIHKPRQPKHRPGYWVMSPEFREKLKHKRRNRKHKHRNYRVKSQNHKNRRRSQPNSRERNPANFTPYVGHDNHCTQRNIPDQNYAHTLHAHQPVDYRFNHQNETSESTKYVSDPSLDSWLYVYGFDIETTAADVVNYVKNRIARENVYAAVLLPKGTDPASRSR